MDWSSEISNIQATMPSGAQAPAGPAVQAAPAAPAAPMSQMAPAAPMAQTTQAAPMAPAAQIIPAAPMVQAPASPSNAAPAGFPAPSTAMNEFAGSTGILNLRHRQPTEVIEAPTSTAEAFSGSLKSALLRNRGNFVAATLLIGSQGTTAWEGILYEVGNDYIVIYQTGRQRYILCDIYALKYIEFYDTKQREICEQLLRQDGSQGYN